MFRQDRKHLPTIYRWHKKKSVRSNTLINYQFVKNLLAKEDFSGKKIVPFATSGTSGIGDSGKNIAELAKNAAVEEGKRFKARASREELKEWAEKYL